MSSHTNLHSPKPDQRISCTSHTKKPVPSSSSSQDQQTLKCPRCNSSNTKFCYYNNYSLSQPRHFCKSCRRYWTRGGALRNVPIGGGCRKTKKSFKPNNNTVTPSSCQRFYSSVMDDSSKSMEQSETIPVDVGSGLSLMGFEDYNNNHSPATFTTAGTLATSIETLSCLNQDLHWRLQQHRMAMLFCNSKEETVVVERPQPVLYRNLEIVNSSPSPTKKGDNHREWYFGNNNDNEGVVSNNTGGSDQWNNGIQAWTDLNHYGDLQ
ncbi:hypothetical protein N665_0451s0006 [Sinapis alba]|nr:hypothetical protein N665_0451s0006 [Sinapis alba]